MKEAPIRLYLDLLPDAHADLEAFSRAAIEFTNLIKDISFIINPSSNIRVQMVRGEPGSWDFKSVIKLILSEPKFEDWTLKGIIFGDIILPKPTR